MCLTATATARVQQEVRARGMEERAPHMQCIASSQASMSGVASSAFRRNKNLCNVLMSVTINVTRLAMCFGGTAAAAAGMTPPPLM
jgi:hypothetical protein